MPLHSPARLHLNPIFTVVSLLLLTPISSTNFLPYHQCDAFKPPISLRPRPGPLFLPCNFSLNLGPPSLQPPHYLPDTPSYHVYTATKTLSFHNPKLSSQSFLYSYRYGPNQTSWGLNIPVQYPGVYQCELTWNEMNKNNFAIGKRVFDIMIQNQTSKNIDVFQMGKNNDDKKKKGNERENRILIKKFKQLKVHGWLEIRLKAKKGNAFLNGIKCQMIQTFIQMKDWEQVLLDEDLLFKGDIVKGIGSNNSSKEITESDMPMSAITSLKPDPDNAKKIDANAFTIDCGAISSKFAIEDLKWIRGPTTSIQLASNVSVNIQDDNSANASLYQSWRYGVASSTWGYTIPLQRSGQYNCELRFAEMVSTNAKTGQRVFNVWIGGQSFNGIDVFTSAGGHYKTAFVIPVRGLKLERTLDITLTPVKGNAFISGISCVRVPSGNPSGGLLITSQTLPDVQESITPLPSSTGEISEPVVISSSIPEVDESPSVEEEPTNFVVVASPDESFSEPMSTGEDPSRNDIPARTDKVPSLDSGEYSQPFELTVHTPGGFDEDLKNEIKLLSASSTETSVKKWYMTKIERDPKMRTISYHIGLDAAFKANRGEEQVGIFKKYVDDGNMTRDLQNSGFKDTTVKFVANPQVTTGTESNGSGLATKIVVGTLAPLACLALIGIIIYVYRNREREYDVDENYDIPPPVNMANHHMVESDTESPENSYNSQRYNIEEQTNELHDNDGGNEDDDDSSFVRPISQNESMGDILDGADRDIWGRGSP